MPAQWTGELISKMHLAEVTAKELAKEVGWDPRYLSTVLNGHREPKKAEEKLKTALEHLLLRRDGNSKKSKEHKRNHGR